MINTRPGARPRGHATQANKYYTVIHETIQKERYDMVWSRQLPLRCNSQIAAEQNGPRRRWRFSGLHGAAGAHQTKAVVATTFGHQVLLEGEDLLLVRSLERHPVMREAGEPHQHRESGSRRRPPWRWRGPCFFLSAPGSRTCSPHETGYCT